MQFGEPDFKWQMVFNTFWVERLTNGVMVKTAYLVQGAPAEVLSVLVATEGIQHLKESATNYLRDFAEIEPVSVQPLPMGKYFSPMFSNHVRLARSGDSGEIAFFTVPLHDIANAARGNISRGASVRAVQVALLHSDVAVHYRLVLELIKLAK